jgi:tetratricopeptide (TPR) repeat protein
MLMAPSIVASGEPSAPLHEVAAAWDLLDRMLYQDAAPVFDRLSAAPDAGPAVQLGHALSLLLRQPRTRGNLFAAERTLDQLADIDDPSWSLLARYHRARYDHVHAFEPDLARAQARYLELWRDHPAQEFGQRAFLHAALLALYEPAASDRKRAQLAELDREALRLTDDGLRRTYHFHAGEAWQRWLGDDERAYAHYLRVADHGLERIEDQAHLLVRLGELALALGRPDDARRWFTDFLREFPRDPRAYLLRLRLSALPAPSPR